MNEDICFNVEEMTNPDGSVTFAATLASDYTRYGYGETRWEAIMNLCDELHNEEPEEEEE